MGEEAKSIVAPLKVSGDGRTSENWASYKRQFERALAARKVEGLYLESRALQH